MASFSLSTYVTECLKRIRCGRKNKVSESRSHVSQSLFRSGGPGGGTAEKPVGLVYIGCAVRSNVYVEKNVFSGDRQQVRRQAADRAIGFALECIKKESV